MAVYIAATIALLFYLCCIPVKFACELRISGGASFGAGIAPFEGRFALRSARKRRLGEKKHLPWRKGGLDVEKSDALPALLRAARYALRHIHLELLNLEGTIGARDAATTALMCGLAQATQAALAPCTSPGIVQLQPSPDFSCGGSDLTFRGMISMTAGHIILTALIGALYYGSRRLALWKENIRLKISCAPRWKTYATWWTWTPSSANPSSPRTVRP